jgi:hypothetical protein
MTHALLRRLHVVDTLLDALDHLGTHDRFGVDAAQMLSRAPDDLGRLIGLGVPLAARYETLILLHRNLLLLNQ